MNQLNVKFLKDLAAKQCYYDSDPNDCVEDWVGGNVDDAFTLGERAGEVMLARQLLEVLGIE